MGSLNSKRVGKDTYYVKSYHHHDVNLMIDSKKYSIPAMGQHLIEFLITTPTIIHCEKCKIYKDGILSVSKDPEDQGDLYKIINISQNITY